MRHKSATQWTSNQEAKQARNKRASTQAPPEFTEKRGKVSWCLDWRNSQNEKLTMSCHTKWYRIFEHPTLWSPCKHLLEVWGAHVQLWIWHALTLLPFVFSTLTAHAQFCLKIFPMSHDTCGCSSMLRIHWQGLCCAGMENMLQAARFHSSKVPVGFCFRPYFAASTIDLWHTAWQLHCRRQEKIITVMELHWKPQGKRCCQSKGS